MQINKNYQLRYMAGEHILMPQNECLQENRTPLIINENTADIVAKITEGYTETQLMEYIGTEYQLNNAQAQKELNTLLHYLRENDIIV